MTSKLLLLMGLQTGVDDPVDRRRPGIEHPCRVPKHDPEKTDIDQAQGDKGRRQRGYQRTAEIGRGLGQGHTSPRLGYLILRAIPRGLSYATHIRPNASLP